DGAVARRRRGARSRAPPGVAPAHGRAGAGRRRDAALAGRRHPLPRGAPTPIGPCRSSGVLARPERVNPLFVAALDLQAFCVGKGWRFCVIGGVAVQRWGEPRLTLAVDVTLLSGFGAEESCVDETLAA